MTCLVLGIIAVRGPLTRWRERRQEIRQARAEPTNLFPLEISLDNSSYPRYSFVRASLKLVDSLGRSARADDPPKITVKHNDERVETVGGLDRLTPKHRARNGAYVYYWPIPWNAPPGRYVVEARCELENPQLWAWETKEEEVRRKQELKDEEASEMAVTGEALCVARVAFEVPPSKPASFPPGMCAVTWEPSFPREPVRKPSGARGDWRAMFDWCEFMGADTLWFRGAATQAYTVVLTMQQPFAQADLDAIPLVAAEAHRRGVKFGAWAMAYNTLPRRSNAAKPPYRYAQDISRSTGEIRETSFVSLLDEDRPKHLAAFFKAMQEDPNVDYIGLDYMRTERDYGLTDDFARKMPVKLPDDWAEMDQGARWKYVARRVEPPGYQEHPEFYEAWNWYRAHLGAQLVARIISKSQVKKPVWVFALSWKHGEQHGQDPIMLTDAGVTMLAQMLYQTESRQHFEIMLKDWPRYVHVGQANILCGDQVDDHWHQKMGPGELYKRMIEAHEQFIEGGHTQGGFWHDISRAAVRGTLGPYPGSEWALAGGAAFSKIRETWGVYPIKANLVAPAKAPVKTPFRAQLNIENIGEKPVRRIKVKPMTTVDVQVERSQPTEVASLGPGQILTIPFSVRIARKNPVRKHRFMTAFRITWPAGSYGSAFRADLPRVIIVMKYVEGTSGSTQR